jgi:hypothetical protein
LGDLPAIRSIQIHAYIHKYIYVYIYIYAYICITKYAYTTGYQLVYSLTASGVLAVMAFWAMPPLLAKANLFLFIDGLVHECVRVYIHTYIHTYIQEELGQGESLSVCRRTVT